MPAPSPELSDAIEEYRAHRLSTDVAKSTIANEAVILRHLLASTGNIRMRNIRERHLDDHFAGRKVAVSTRNHELSVIKGFFKWAERRRMLGPEGNVAAHRRYRKVMPRKRLRIPASEFPRLLDLAPHPTDRMVFALGIYLLLRQSEVKGLRVGDVNLTTGEISVTVEKTRQRDVMPISLELDDELRTWLTWYAQHLGRPLRDDDFLVPAKTKPQFTKGGTQRQMRLLPHTPVGAPHLAIQRILVAGGYDIRDPESGKSNSEGVHTLRRSAARAIFDGLVDQAYDGALRHVQSLLHHANSSQTEEYLGLDLDVHKRDELVRGKYLYPGNRERSTVIGISRIAGIEGAS